MNFPVFLLYSFLIVGIICLPETGHADSDKIQMIELTKNHESRHSTHSSAKQRRRADLIAHIENNREAMRKNGFVSVSNLAATTSERLFDEIVSSHSNKPNDKTAHTNNVAYTTIDLTAQPLASADFLGVLPVEFEDKSIHQMFYAFSDAIIGNLVIEELNFSTITDGTISVASPAGNIYINGTPGTYIISINKTGTKVTSSLNFLTAEKIFTLTTSNRLDVGSEEYKKLIAIAESL